MKANPDEPLPSAILKTASFKNVEVVVVTLRVEEDAACPRLWMTWWSTVAKFTRYRIGSKSRGTSGEVQPLGGCWWLSAARGPVGKDK